MPDPFSPDSTHSQLVREAKVGFSIVMIVIISVVYWSFHRYHQIHHEVPEHIRAAPIATQVGPEGYLDDPETGQLAPEYGNPVRVASNPPSSVSNLRPGGNVTSRSVDEPAVEKISRLTDNRLAESPRPAGEDVSPTRIDGPLTAGSQSNVLVSLTEKVDRLEKLAESLMESRAATPSLPPPINKSVNPLKLASRDMSASLPAYEAKKTKPRRQKQHADNPATDSNESNAAEANTAESEPDDFVPQRPRAAVPAGDDISTQLVSQDPEIEPVGYQQENSVTPELTTDVGGPRFRSAESRFADNEQIPANQQRVDGKSEQMIVDAEGSYQTQMGDSFWTIAELKYGDGRFFRALYEHNRSSIDDFDRLPINTMIKTPALDYLKLQYRELCPPDQLAATTRQRVYTTIEGDTLFDISRRSTGQASRYVELLKLNRDRLPMGANHLTRLPSDIELTLPQ